MQKKEFEMEMKSGVKFAVLFSIALAFTLSCSSLDAQTKLKNAPVNPEFVKFMTDSKAGKTVNKSDDGHYLGDCPAPVELSNVKPVKSQGKQYPVSYDLRTLNKVTPVRNQGAYGTCWTFGSLGSLESILMPLVPNPDLSENNIANYAGFDSNFSGGGSTYMSAAYMARWSGPFNETEDAYPNPGYLPPLDTALQYHMQNIIFVPSRPSPIDNDIIKEMITDHGACSLSFYYDSQYYNSTNYAFYNGVDTVSNHAVTLAGWNDNFPASSFNTAPPGNGAFLIKNSWGTSWGNEGYFWISYYDTSIRRITCFYGAESIQNYTGICQYDELGLVGSTGNNTDTYWGSNIFTAGSSDPVSAVSTWAVSSNCAYEIRVYAGVSAGNPTSGTLASTETGTIELPGYYTINLGTPATVTEGQLFSVVVKYTTPGYNMPLPYEYAQDGYTSAATAMPGQSFYSGDGTSWTDFHGEDPTANVCIKAFGPSSPNGLTGMATHVTVGSEFYVECPSGQFDAKPTCYITGGGLGEKKKSIKILKGTRPEYPTDTIRCQWSNKLTPDKYSLYVQRKVKGQKPAPELVSSGFFIELPEITNMVTSVSPDLLRQISLTGLNFGIKKPKLYLKYTLNEKEKKLTCKISEYNSNMLQGSIKESSLQKLREKGVTSFDVILENAIGADQQGWYIE